MLGAAIAGALAAPLALLAKLLAVEEEPVALAPEAEAEGWEATFEAAVTACVSALPICAIEPD